MWQRKPWGLGGHNDVRLSSAFFVVNAWFESGLFGAHAYARSGSVLWCFPEVKSTSKDWKIGQNESKDQSYRCAGCATGSGKARACNLYGSAAALARYRKSRAGQVGHAPGDAYDNKRQRVAFRVAGSRKRRPSPRSL